jgi:hypothetical protein
MNFTLSSMRANLKGGTPLKRVISLFCLAALCLFMGFSTMAQSDAGTLLGTVLDADGKAVVGATVTVTDVNTNLTLPPVKTGDNGRYAVNDLPPGHYRVTVSAPNFKNTVENDVEIIQRKTYELPIKLEIGASTVNVEVVAGQQLLETVNTATNATITGRSITNLPLNSRSSLLLAVLDPGAQTVGGPRNSAFEGLPKGTINITFDGINAQDNTLKSNDGFFSINDPRIDDVEEFGITTSGNDPSKTGDGAVQVAYTSKKGGNAFHGGVWEYNRNQDFNSNYYFNNAQGLPRTKDQLNDYGYKVGGPIFKDKLFFFTDFDFFEFPQSVLRSRTIYTTGAAAKTANGTVGLGSAQGFFNYIPVNSAGANALPSAAQLAAAPWVTCNGNAASPLCTVQLLPSAAAGATASSLSANGPVAGLPTTINGVVGPYLTAINGFASAPGNTVSAALVSPFQESVGYNAPTIGYRKYPDVRLDYNLTKHHSLEFDYHYSHFGGGPDVLNNADATFNVAPFNTSQGNQISNRSLFVLAERWTIGSNKSNEIRLGLKSNPVNFGLGVTSGTPQNPLFPQTATNQNPAGGLPYTFGLAGVSPLFLGLGGSQGRNDGLFEIHDTFGWTKGSHQISFGGDATYIDYNDFFRFNAAEALGISSFDPAIGDFNNCFSDLSQTCQLPNVSATQQGNVEGLYGSLTGRVTSFSNTAAFNPFNQTYSATANGSSVVDKFGQLELGFYGGDSWRVRPNLTFNYGLRWEYSGPPYDKLNEDYILQNSNDVFGISGPGNLFHPGSTGGNANAIFVNDAGKSYYNGYHKAFAPSVGLAYQPNWDNRLAHHIFGGSGKTVLRAGFSIAYSREGINSFASIAESNPGRVGSQVSVASVSNSLANSTFQAGTITLGQTINDVSQTPQTFNNFIPLSPTVGQSVNTYDPNLKPPLVESWNASVQRELSPNLAFEIRYVANHGVGLIDQFNLNEVNIFENGFLNEFNNAALNQNICLNVNRAGCLAAEQTAGIVAATATSPVADFANLGLAGQVNVPILTAAFTGSTTGSQTTGGLTRFFHNSTLTSNISVGGAGSFANNIGTGSANFTSFLANLQTAGFPSNFFVVNPTATGGAFVTANGAQSTYNSLVLDLRHRPSHGIQFDASYVFSKSLTNYQANSSVNFFQFTTLRNLGLDKGPAPFDTRHNVKVQVVYSLPFGAGHRLSSSHGFVNKAIGGWEVDTVTRFQTGQPVLITSGVSGGNTFNGNSTSANNGSGINLVGLTIGQIQSELGVNKTAVPGAVTYLPVNLLSGPGQSATANAGIFQPCNVAGALCGKPYITSPSFFRADISLVKTTKITERVNFEIRMEALNALNDADFYYATAPGTAPASISTQSNRFGLIGSSNTNGAYSDINTTQDPGGRVVQLVGRINF